MKQLSRRILLLLPLLTMLALGAWAEQTPVKYYYHNWESVSGTYRVTNYGGVCNEYKVLNSSTHTDGGNFGVGDNPEWDDGGYKWVVVEGDVNIKTLIVIGEGHLILKGGAKLTCTGGVKIGGESTLHIYVEQDKTAQLIANNTENSGQAGIGCAPSAESGGMGTLVIHGGTVKAYGPSDAAGIGGGKNRGIKGTLVVWDGDVQAYGGKNAAGIGGGNDGSQGGEVKIYGGKVYAKGGEDGAGIGGGDGGDGGHVHVYGSGADVTALGGKNGAGIGGGNSGNGSNWANSELLTVDGGKVTATGGEDGAGIGGGWQKNKGWIYSKETGLGGLVTINGGEVIAQGGTNAAGIGTGGSFYIGIGIEEFATTLITGGTVKATGGKYGAGIGGGVGAKNKNTSAQIKISGGVVIAQGGDEAAGIGSGRYGHMHKVVISGGTVTATGGDEYPGIGNKGSDVLNLYNCSVEISGGTVTAIGTNGGAGIGGTSDNSETAIYPIKISGGEVRAVGSSVGGAGIGAGGKLNHAGSIVTITGGTIVSIAHGDMMGGAIGCAKNGTPGKIIVGDGMRVSNGSSEDALTVAVAGQRGTACRNESMLVAKLEPCSDHSEINADTYIYSGIANHTVRCKYCNYSVTEAHTFENNVCTKCGGSETTVNHGVTLNRPSAINITSYDKGDLYTVGSGKNFTLPEGPEVNGLVFMGWDETQPTTGTYPYLLADNITPAHQPGYVVVNVTTTKTFYARYIKSTSEEWTWDTSTDTPTAKVAVTMGGTTTDYGATVTLKEQQAATAEADGYKTYTATYSKTDEGRTYTFTNEMRVPVPYVYVIALANETGNAEKITTHDKRLANVTLTGHTLYKDGHWNTLCLPFDVTTASGPLSGDGVSAKVLDGTTSSLTGGTLTLNFTDVASDDVIPAGTPFIIKWTGGSDIVGPVFENVLVQSDLNSETFQGGTFEGSYVPFAITSENINQIAYLGAGDVLGYATEARTLRAFRAHFVLPTTVSGSRAMTRAIINYGDGTTAIVSLRDGITERVGSAPESWYDLQGRRLEGRPQVKGIYIRDGKKVVIK